MTTTNQFHPIRTVVLVGMMGAGKTAIGRRLAKRLDLDFIDADDEIEIAAGCSIPDIFKQHGETAFRDGERRVIERLLNEPIHVLATGGGAFMDLRTRTLVKQDGVSVWLRADIEVLWRRVSRRGHRPMLKTDNPRATLSALIDERYPVYAEANVTVESRDGHPEETVDRVVDALLQFVPSGKQDNEYA
jgi:shikimate kinase